MVLAGGKTPQLLYEKFVMPQFAASMPWRATHLFWGDERCLPPDDPDSNYKNAYAFMISKAPIPTGNVHRIPAELAAPQEAARHYEQQLRDFFNLPQVPDAEKTDAAPSPLFPSFDLILLGMGDDGHTASLFPGDDALHEESRWVVAIPRPVGSPPVPRITLTLPVINEAACVMFLVSGSGKEEVLRAIVKSPETARILYPAAMVRPKGRLLLLHDYERLK